MPIFAATSFGLALSGSEFCLQCTSYSPSPFLIFCRNDRWLRYRGEVAFYFDWTVLYLTAIGLLILSFYVVDAIQLNSNFIRMFAREVTKWGRGVVERSHLARR